MNNIFVYIELEGTEIADVSLELLTKGKQLATQLNKKLEAICIGSNLAGIEKQLYPYGVDVVHVADDKRLSPYTTLPHNRIVCDLFEREKPEIALFGATSMGRDLAPRVCSTTGSGLTADCTSLEIGDHVDPKTKTEYKNLLYQIRPAFGGNIIATIINPETRPQIATVREGVMKKEIFDAAYKGELKKIEVANLLQKEDFVIQVIERQIEKSKVNLKGAPIIVSGGYGVGSKENFQLLYDLARVLGAEVGASRAAVDAGYAEHERQVGQTGITVRPKLYIACGISGAVQHTAGMAESAMVIAINNDENAPINAVADYTIHGDLNEIIPKMIKYYKSNTK
ncbi:MAG: electron transfer flavoprotein subunit alpha/FixB family protein [Bacteroidales bacterium]|mgnify:CR=1 FL=1|nr:electron transfer flavoprotein subunit alpha/FixB family protein [Bacteroidales bacterium]NLK81832.1 electron transfer flavoprotein subunit alpha/FixB family protein [Bacteroidales bacterium]HPY81979.1 electron transfer flavoprotein subunit alpha/FixB family protein [Bacteroidales bacterium]